MQRDARRPAPSRRAPLRPPARPPGACEQAALHCARPPVRFRLARRRRTGAIKL